MPSPSRHGAPNGTAGRHLHRHDEALQMRQQQVLHPFTHASAANSVVMAKMIRVMLLAMALFAWLLVEGAEIHSGAGCLMQR